MKQIDRYILEKLHINKDTKIKYKYIEGEPIICAYIEYHSLSKNPTTGINGIYKFKYFKDNIIFFSDYNRENNDTSKGFINSNGIFESISTWHKSIFLPKNEAEEYYDDLMKYKDNLKDFPYEKDFDTPINGKERIELNNMEKIERYYKMLNETDR
jgi:hypothetical protein